MAQQTQRVSLLPGLRGSVGGHLDAHVGADLPSLIFCRQEPRLQAVRRSTSAGTRPPRRPPDHRQHHRQHGPPHHFKLGAAISAGDDDLGTLQRSGHGTPMITSTVARVLTFTQSRRPGWYLVDAPHAHVDVLDALAVRAAAAAGLPA
jgi:hypothetical protein